MGRALDRWVRRERDERIRSFFGCIGWLIVWAAVLGGLAYVITLAVRAAWGSP